MPLIKYLLGLLLLTFVAAAVAAWNMNTPGRVALALLAALFQAVAYAGVTQPRVITGMVIAAFARAKRVEPYLLKLLERAVDLNAKVMALAEEMAASIKAQFSSVTERVPVVGPVVNAVVRRVPLALLTRRLAPRIQELLDMQKRFGFSEQQDRAERAAVLLEAFRTSTRENLGATVRTLLMLYGMLVIVENALIIYFK